MKKFMCCQILSLLLIQISCRKYDLESEAIKLYGEDLQTVLKRFRKTPDYLSILNDKLKELYDHKENVAMLTMYHFMEKLNKKIGEMIGLDQRVESTTSAKPQNFFRNHFTYRRQEPESSENLTPVQKLDSYPTLSSTLSVAERNSYMDLGFEYAGHIIHTMIKSLGPDDEASVKSTRLPYGGDHHHEKKFTTTTEHVQVHEVTPSTTVIDSTVALTTSSTPSFRHRFNSQLS